MATFTYNHAVKVNGKVIPPNTPVEIGGEKDNTPAKKPKKKKE